MQFLILAFLGALGAAMASLVGRVLLALGLGFVTYKGVDLLFDQVADQIRNNLSQSGTQIIGFLGYIYFDKFINIILSAYAVRITMDTTDGIIRKILPKP